MENQSTKRTKWLTIRMSPDEYQQLEMLARETTSSSISEYGRKVLLGKPVIKRYRNESLDDFLADMLELRKDLNHIGNNFNKAVYHLHKLRDLPDIQQWILVNEQDKTELYRQIETITQKINQIHQLWSQE
jgi:hypothetical protein